MICQVSAGPSRTPIQPNTVRLGPYTALAPTPRLGGEHHTFPRPSCLNTYTIQVAPIADQCIHASSSSHYSSEAKVSRHH
jgi:hypothetical protein